MAKDELLLVVGVGVVGLIAWKMGALDSIISAIQNIGQTPTPTPTPDQTMTTPPTSQYPTETTTSAQYPSYSPQIYPTSVQTVPVAVPINIPAVGVEIIKTDKKSDNFAAAVESQIRKNCPAGSIGPGSSECRSNVRHYFPEYAAAYGATSSTSMKNNIVRSVATATNCCCTPTGMPCIYQAHIGPTLQTFTQT